MATKMVNIQHSPFYDQKICDTTYVLLGITKTGVRQGTSATYRSHKTYPWTFINGKWSSPVHILLTKSINRTYPIWVYLPKTGTRSEQYQNECSRWSITTQYNEYSKLLEEDKNIRLGIGGITIISFLAITVYLFGWNYFLHMLGNSFFWMRQSSLF